MFIYKFVNVAVNFVDTMIILLTTSFTEMFVCQTSDINSGKHIILEFNFESTGCIIEAERRRFSWKLQNNFYSCYDKFKYRS